MTVIVGVDPGARWTGIAVHHNDGDRYGGSLTLDRGPAANTLDEIEEYLVRVVAAVRHEVTARGAQILAVEGIRRPSWHVRSSGGGARAAANPSHLVATAMVYGAVVAGPWPDLRVVIVPPDRHGQHPIALYPPKLRPTSGRGAGSDRHRHERAAYDVARFAVGHERIRRLKGATP